MTTSGPERLKQTPPGVEMATNARKRTQRPPRFTYTAFSELGSAASLDVRALDGPRLHGAKLAIQLSLQPCGVVGVPGFDRTRTVARRHWGGNELRRPFIQEVGSNDRRVRSGGRRSALRRLGVEPLWESPRQVHVDRWSRHPSIAIAERRSTLGVTRKLSRCLRSSRCQSWNTKCSTRSSTMTRPLRSSSTTYAIRTTRGHFQKKPRRWTSWSSTPSSADWRSSGSSDENRRRLTAFGDRSAVCRSRGGA